MQTHFDDELTALTPSFDKGVVNSINLIASSSVMDPGVSSILGNAHFNNTNVEGYPARSSFYGTATHADPIQQLAIDRAKTAFGCGFANVQSFSASIANLATIMALQKQLHAGHPNAKLKICSLDTAFGGHFTHGQTDSLTERFCKTYPIPLARDGKIDLARLDDTLADKKLDVLLVGGSSNTQQYNFELLKECCQRHNVLLWVDASHHAGYMITGQYKKPFPYADIVTCSLHKSLPGPRAGLILSNDKTIAEAIDKAVYPGIQGEPNLANMAAIAYVLHAATHDPKYARIARDTYRNATALAKGLQSKGLRLTGGETQTHIVMADMTDTEISGREAALFLNKIGILCNQMPLAKDGGGILDVDQMNGLRFGTYAMTWRGLNPGKAEQLGEIIGSSLKEYIAAKKECGDDAAELERRVDAIARKNDRLLDAIKHGRRISR